MRLGVRWHQNGSYWEYNLKEGWSKVFPFQKPNLPCQILSSKVSLKDYKIDWGNSVSPSPSANSNSTNTNKNKPSNENSNKKRSSDSDSSESGKVKETPEPTSTPFPLSQDDVENVIGNYFGNLSSRYGSFNIVRQYMSESFISTLEARFDAQGLTLESVINNWVNKEKLMTPHSLDSKVYSSFSRSSSTKATMKIKGGDGNFYLVEVVVEDDSPKINAISKVTK